MQHLFLRVSFVRLFLLSLALLSLLLVGNAFAAPWGYGSPRPLKPSDFGPHPNSSLTYFEQWSSTMQFENGEMLNLNIVGTNMASGDEKALFRVEYRSNSGTIRDKITCGSFKYTPQPFSISCGGARLSGSDKELNVQFPGKTIKVQAKLSDKDGAWRPGDGRLSGGSDKDDFYDNMMIMRRAAAEATVNGVAKNGTAFVDHSYTTTAWHNISRHWIRLSYVGQDFSMIFAVNVKSNGSSAGWVSVADAKGHVYSSSDLTIELSDYWKDNKKDGFGAYRSISLSSKDGAFSLKLPGMTFYGRKDMLADLGKVKAFFVRSISDPMQYQFTGNMTVNTPFGSFAKNVRVTTKQFNK